MMFKKIVIIAIASLTLGNLVFPSFLKATVFADQITISSNNQERSASGVAVFFGGMVVAWVVDGTIEYATGKAPSEWVAMGLSQIENHIIQQAKNGSSKMVIPESGPFTCPGVPIDHSGMCG
ncbi:hypothetical protein GRB29_08430 [Streptococcus pneumoniae]|nr:hypothetical protein [Streptococcus pneumoniae]